MWTVEVGSMDSDRENVLIQCSSHIFQYLCINISGNINNVTKMLADTGRLCLPGLSLWPDIVDYLCCKDFTEWHKYCKNLNFLYNCVYTIYSTYTYVCCLCVNINL